MPLTFITLSLLSLARASDPFALLAANFTAPEEWGAAYISLAARILEGCLVDANLMKIAESQQRLPSVKRDRGKRHKPDYNYVNLSGVFCGAKVFHHLLLAERKKTPPPALVLDPFGGSGTYHYFLEKGVALAVIRGIRSGILDQPRISYIAFERAVEVVNEHILFGVAEDNMTSFHPEEILKMGPRKSLIKHMPKWVRKVFALKSSGIEGNEVEYCEGGEELAERIAEESGENSTGSAYNSYLVIGESAKKEVGKKLNPSAVDYVSKERIISEWGLFLQDLNLKSIPQTVLAKICRRYESQDSFILFDPPFDGSASASNAARVWLVVEKFCRPKMVFLNNVNLPGHGGAWVKERLLTGGNWVDLFSGRYWGGADKELTLEENKSSEEEFSSSEGSFVGLVDAFAWRSFSLLLRVGGFD